MKIIGVTGGIGSGKTTICKLFEIFGIPVYYTDESARHLTDFDPVMRRSISQLFGDNIYEKGVLNRKKLGGMVFDDPILLAKLNQIVHPVVASHFQKWLGERQHFPVVAKESAILFESGAFKSVDYLVTVTAPIALRIERVMRRDGLSEKQILSRMANQWPEEKKIGMSHVVIHADEFHLVIPQVINTIKKIRKNGF
ncbi:MAG: dephospho-CoA kinase [Breznakibacter sp.]